MAICIVVPTFYQPLNDKEDPNIEVFYENKSKDKVMMVRYVSNQTGDVIGGYKYDVKKTFDMGEDGIFKPVKWRYEGDNEWKVIERRY